MRHRVVWTAVLLTFCAALRAAAAGVELHGRVVDGDGEGLAGAVVELWPWLSSFEGGMGRLEGDAAGDPLATGRSDGGGFFEIKTAAGGSLRLEVRAAGRLPMEIRQARPAAEVELRTVTLVPAAELVVRVVSGAGNRRAEQRRPLERRRDRCRGEGRGASRSWLPLRAGVWGSTSSDPPAAFRALRCLVAS